MPYGKEKKKLLRNFHASKKGKKTTDKVLRPQKKEATLLTMCHVPKAYKAKR